MHKMCLLVVCPPGHRMTDHQITRAWENNPDGGGFAHLTKEGRIRPFKTMKLKAFRQAYHQAVKRHPGSPFIIHFRMATHGTTDLSNVHPFWVNDHTVMAHNGIISIATYDQRSDTRTFVEDWLPDLPVDWLDNAFITLLVEEFIDWSKLAFLTTDSRLEKPYYILNEDKGDWVKGVWFSNTSHKTKPKPKVQHKGWEWYGANATKRPAEQSAAAFLAALDDDAKGEVPNKAYDVNEDDPILCPFCEREAVDAWCDYCDICLDCGEYAEECNCGMSQIRARISAIESRSSNRHLPL